MTRPDYWTRPVQGARSAHDYGNTRLLTDSPRGTIRVTLLILATFSAAMLFFIAIGLA